MCPIVQMGFLRCQTCAIIDSLMIDSILDDIEIRIEPFALCSFTHNSILDLERNNSGTIHYVLGGDGEIELGREHRLKLTEGMLILVPSGKQHVLRGGSKMCSDFPECFPLQLHLAHLPIADLSTRDSNLVLLCAYVDIALLGFHNVLYGVTEPITFDTRKDPVTSVLLPLLMRELTAPRPGGKATVRSLIWIAFIQLLRASLEPKSTFSRELRILSEPRLLPAVQALLAESASAHTVQSLASRAAMSRSAFAARFRHVYGVGPMEFLRQHRVESAAKLLANPSMSVSRIAYEVGFLSRSAFSRAFKSVMHCSPQEYKNRLGAENQTTRM